MNKQILIVIFAFIVITLSSLFTAHHYYEKYKDEKHEKTNLLILNSRKIKDIEYYQNENDKLIAKNEAVLFENKTVKELVKNGELKWLNEFKGVNKRLSNLEYAYKIEAQINDSLTSKLNFITKNYINQKGDTVPFNAFKWGRNHKFGYDSLIQVTPDSVLFKEKELIPLDGVMYKERKYPILWIFSPKIYSAEIYSENPDVEITELLNIKIKKK